MPRHTAPSIRADQSNWREKLLASLRADTVAHAPKTAHHALLRYGSLAGAITLLAFYGILELFFQTEAGRPRSNVEFLQTWHLIALIFIAPPAILLIRIFRRAGARRAGDELMHAGSRRPILYLRSFGLDKIIGRISWEEILSFHVLPSDEELMAALLRRYGPVIAIGRPGERLPALGAARFYVSNDVWKEKVAEVARVSQLVIWTTGHTEGLRWEISYLLNTVPPERLS